MSVNVREKRKGSGVWWIFINHAGQRRSKQIGPKAEAVKLADIIRGKLAAGDIGIDGISVKRTTKTFGHYCEAWQNSGSFRKGTKKERKLTTLEDYAVIIKHHLKGSSLWNTAVGELTKNQIETFIENARSAKNRSKPLTAGSKKHIKVVISHVLKYIADDGIDIANHALGITISSDVDPNKALCDDDDHGSVVYTPAEIERLLGQLEGQYFYPPLFLMVHTGLRCAEAAGLIWDDVDLETRTITIRRAWVRKRETSPKSGKIRYIDMSHDLVDMLRQHRKNQFKDPKQENNGLVFQNKKPKKDANGVVNRHIDLNSIRKGIYQTALRKAGLPPSRLHDLRHSFATNLARATGDPVYCYEQLGHHSIDFTMKCYFKSQRNQGSERKIDKLFCTQPHPIRTLAAEVIAK
ncbi:tyrosine-type recombinase/integrase [Thermodesulfobacteriota bacterium]